MSAAQTIARNLAAAFLAGSWSLDGLVRRAAQACGQRERWLRPLARRVLAAFAEPPHLQENLLARFIMDDSGFDRACARHCRAGELPLRRLFWATPTMAATPWQVPALTTTTALAEWLGLRPAELDWFADCRNREEKVPPGPLRHYTYRWLPQRSGKLRLLEMPKQRLKAIQRRVLHAILDGIPPHGAVHSYRRGRSVASYALPHAGRRLVLCLDLRDFFPSVRAARVHALFRTAGYPPAVARALTGLCTNVVPPEVGEEAPQPARNLGAWEARQLFRAPHLPQGAPTSPALANLCAYRLDCRLDALARTVGATYTRYADDLAFSGAEPLERSVRRFHVHVCRIALEEGFEVHTRKTRFMRQGIRQQLAGIVLNSHPNIPRAEYDQLKAILTNCIRHGPRSQNRAGREDFRAHLAGRIAYVHMLNAARGRRLRELFDRIAWVEEV